VKLAARPDGVSSKAVDLSLKFLHKLSTLLREDSEEASKFAVGHVFRRVSETFFSVFAGFDEIDKNGYDFVVTHMEFAVPH
jgi:hypothetical protein